MRRCKLNVEQRTNPDSFEINCRRGFGAKFQQLKQAKNY